MREQVLINAMAMHDRAINSLRAEFRAMQKVLDKTYVQSLTHVMMWDVLMGLLEEKGVITKMQFDAALKDLSDKTKAAMAEDEKKKADAAAAESSSKVTVVSDVPAIPVVK